jgi:hypothetical protein
MAAPRLQDLKDIEPEPSAVRWLQQPAHFPKRATILQDALCFAPAWKVDFQDRA